MRIALLAPLWKTVPPQKYGGSELVVANLARGYVALGHDVTLFACRGSETPAKLIEVTTAPVYDLRGGFSWDGIQAYEFLSYNALFERKNNFDVVHNHMGFHPVVFEKILSIPMITTGHSSVAPDFPYLLDVIRDGKFVSISDAQRSLAPMLNYVATIYHGIDTKAFTSQTSFVGEYLLFVGSLTKNKGIDVAIRAARELNKKLIIAGEVRAEDKEFLDKEVYPYIDGNQITFIGEVDHAQKNELYKNAQVTLFPSQWNEAFGLVMVESLACGTPVVGYNKGSVPEVINHGVTGFVVSDFEEFKKAIIDSSALSRERCRQEAEQRFDLMAMSKSYIELFSKYVKK